MAVSVTTFSPVIRDLGGETSIRGFVDAISEVYKQWK